MLDKAAPVLRDMLPYKRARLTGMKVSGDRDAPLFNLSALSDQNCSFCGVPSSRPSRCALR
jgi:hypothetical protein